MEMTGAELVCRILKDEGVRYVFGVPGSTEIPLLDALAKTSEITYISAIHESVAMGMGDGYARASGKVGVVLVHTAPGTAYILGNLYNAYNAGSPIVVLAGQQDSRFQWCDPFLDTDLLPMVSEYTKNRWWVGNSRDMQKALARAFKEATTPPKGPVFLAIPRDLQEQTVVFDGSSAQSRQVPMTIGADRGCLVKAAELLAGAEQPAILAGHQVPDAEAVGELAALAELLGAPVYTTAQVPKLIFPTIHPLYYSRVPPIGFSFPGLQNPADVLLAVGSRLFKQLFHVEGPLLPLATKMIQIDLDPAALGRDCPVEVALVAHPKTALSELATEVDRLMSHSQSRKSRQRFDQLKNARAESKVLHEMAFKKDWDAVPLRPARAIKEIAGALPPGSIVVDEAVMMTTYVEYIMEFSEPGTYFSCNASLGWGLPASLGIALASPGRPVVALVGDGSMLFGLQALWTAAQYQIPVIVVILNNSGYAAIKWAFSMHSKETPTDWTGLGLDLGKVDFLKLTQGFGIGSQIIEEGDRIGPALKSAIREGKPTVFDLALDPKDVGYGLPRLP